VDPWLLLLLCIAALVFWLVSRPQAVFVVSIRGGQPEATHGKVTAAFLTAVAELCGEHQVTSGEVRGLARGRRISLWFSDGVPAGFQQQLRNWWALSGWAARPGRA
jgi:hypothetical protein